MYACTHTYTQYIYSYILMYACIHTYTQYMSSNSDIVSAQQLLTTQVSPLKGSGYNNI